MAADLWSVIKIALLIVVLAVVIRIQQGFDLQQLLDHPELLWPSDLRVVSW